MMKKLLYALLAFAFLSGLAGESFAQQTKTTAVASLTRAGDTTTYTANTLVCASKSVDCVPIPIVLGRSQGPGTGVIVRFQLSKSGSTTTNANFIAWLFSASPKVTGLKDNSAYTGPYNSDLTAGAYLGNYTCAASSAVTGTDSNVIYECSASSLTGYTPFATTVLGNAGGTLYMLLSVTAAYAPAASEAFSLQPDALQD